MKTERGFTLVELLVVVAIVGVLASLAVAEVLRARAAANESSAISSMRAIASAQLSYSTACGRGAYATSLITLGAPVPGAVPFLSADLTAAPTVVKSGYDVTLGPSALGAPGPTDCNGTPTEISYYASAAPLSFGTSGFRSFALNADAVIWQVSGAVPPAEPFAAPATPLQ